jgi:site-specific recombinase XerD
VLAVLTTSDLVVPADRDLVADATAAWLASKKPTTRDAYRRDLASWEGFCWQRGVDPLLARKPDADLFGAWLQDPENPRRISATSAARRMAAVSSWYRYLVRCDLHDRNPFAAAERPRIDKDYSATAWLDQAGAQAMIDAVEAQTNDTRLRDIAMIRLMLQLGLRVSEVCGLQVSALGMVNGQRVLTIVGKGGKRITRVLPESAWHAVEAHLLERCQRANVRSVYALGGPLLATRGGKPVDRQEAFRLVRRVAVRARVPDPGSMSPHALRHTFATLATERGADLDDLQDAMGHADPRTTRRYQRAARRLDRDPANLVSGALV